MDAEAEDFRSFDIGVYPLVDDEWNARKSALKAVQYMASAVPFVMSPVGICATMGVPGETHLLATTDEEWLAALRRLLTDAELRTRMGRAGRKFAEEHYSLDAVADTLAPWPEQPESAGVSMAELRRIEEIEQRVLSPRARLQQHCKKCRAC